MTDRTEAEAVAALALAQSAGQPLELDAGKKFAVPLPEGWTLQRLDTEVDALTPLRARGTVHVHDAGGFIDVVQRRAEDPDGFTVYADEERMALVCVLNDDTSESPGWRDHRVELQLRRRPEWEHWVRSSGALMEQEAFANHVEEGLSELVSPSASDMLDLAQTFHATTAGRFKGGHRLASGARQFVWEEEINATAGAAGELTIPERMELAIRPFFGADKFAVEGRFRFQLRDGNLKLGYVLERPAEVERVAFAGIRESVGDGLNVTIIAGVAPPAR